MAAEEPGSHADGSHDDLIADLSGPVGVAVRNGFLSAARVRSLIDCAETRRERGDFSAARVGAHASLQQRTEIRGDSTCWLEEPLFAEERSLLADLEQLRLDLNRDAFLGLLDLELHYARYPPGAGYLRHIDQPQGRHQRKASVILYLNEAWERGGGGELRVFDAAGGHLDIEPVAGRLVCFLTAGRAHAVLPTRAHRLSLSGWFRVRE